MKSRCSRVLKGVCVCVMFLWMFNVHMDVVVREIMLAEEGKEKNDIRNYRKRLPGNESKCDMMVISPVP